jgi:hypothetical protein
MRSGKKESEEISMGHFVGNGNLEYFVDDDGKWYNGIDKAIEYDPETRAVIAKRIVVQSLVSPSGEPIASAPVAPKAPAPKAPVASQVGEPPPLTYEERKQARIKELNATKFPILKKMCPGTPNTLSKAQAVSIITEREFGDAV